MVDDDMIKKQILVTDREIDDFLNALASKTRRKIIFLLMDDKERTVNEIAQEVGLGQSTASEHLGILKRAYILFSVKRGKEVYYKTNKESISKILKKLSDYMPKCNDND